MIPREMTPQEIKAIQDKEFVAEEHVIVDDRRRKPFISMEEFERKWGINQPPKE